VDVSPRILTFVPWRSVPTLTRPPSSWSRPLRIDGVGAPRHRGACMIRTVRRPSARRRTRSRRQVGDDRRSRVRWRGCRRPDRVAVHAELSVRRHVERARTSSAPTRRASCQREELGRGAAGDLGEDPILPSCTEIMALLYASALPPLASVPLSGSHSGKPPWRGRGISPGKLRGMTINTDLGRSKGISRVGTRILRRSFVSALPCLFGVRRADASLCHDRRHRPQDPTTVYAGHQRRGVFKSTDRGGSWSASTTG